MYSIKSLNFIIEIKLHKLLLMSQRIKHNMINVTKLYFSIEINLNNFVQTSKRNVDNAITIFSLQKQNCTNLHHHS